MTSRGNRVRLLIDHPRVWTSTCRPALLCSAQAGRRWQVIATVGMWQPQGKRIPSESSSTLRATVLGQERLRPSSWLSQASSAWPADGATVGSGTTHVDDDGLPAGGDIDFLC